SSRSAQMDWQGSARLRFGWANDHVLLYVTGGGAFAQVTSRAVDSATSSFFFESETFLLSNPLGSGTSGGPPFIFNEIPIGTVTDTNVAQSDEILTGWT